MIKIIKTLSETVQDIDKKLGLHKFITYGVVFLFFLAALNFKSILKTIMLVHTEMVRLDHEKRLVMRDNLTLELQPLLVELRASTSASRILYFEYHNSTENFIGIPFKYASLVLFDQEYSCAGYDPSRYIDINSGLITGLYGDLKKNKIVINRGIENDELFYKQYPGIHEFFSSQDGSKQQAFINVPGIKFPIGMIVLEWMEEEKMTDLEWLEVQAIISENVPRINAVISKYTP